MYFSRQLNEKNNLQFSYSKRIDRPTISQLAPFVLLVTPETFVIGNEKLLPAISNILKADYQYKTFMFSVSYTDTQDAISRFQPKYDEEEDRHYITSQNFDNQKTLSVMSAFPINISDWWRMQNNFSWYLRKVQTNYEGEDLDINQDDYRINSIQSFTISKAISAEISGYYQSKSLRGIRLRKPIGRVDIGVQYKLKNGNSRLNLNVTDVFQTNIFRSEVNIPELNLKSSSSRNWETRIVRLTFTHSFGNAAIKERKRKTASEEEQKRVTG